MVTRGQSPPDLIVSTVKYILQRPLWVYGQRICCTDLAMLCSLAVHKKLEHFPEHSPAHSNHGYFIVHPTPYQIAKLRINTSNLLGIYSNTIYYLPSVPTITHVVTRGKSIILYVGMLRNYLKSLLSTKIVKTNFSSKNTGNGLYGYLTYLLKNDPVNIVISTSYRLLTFANRTTARRFQFRQSVTK